MRIEELTRQQIAGLLTRKEKLALKTISANRNIPLDQVEAIILDWFEQFPTLAMASECDRIAREIKYAPERLARKSTIFMREDREPKK